jgi:hypothetical protein
VSPMLYSAKSFLPIVQIHKIRLFVFPCGGDWDPMSRFSERRSSLLLFSTSSDSLFAVVGLSRRWMICVALTMQNIAIEPDFVMSCTPDNESIAPGKRAQYPVTINAVGGWSNEVGLSVDGVRRAGDRNR